MPVTRSTTHARHPMRPLAPVLGLLLMVFLFVGGTHHHVDGMHHGCAVCTAGHAPAVEADFTTPEAALAPATQPVVTLLERAPRSARLESAPSRAPPSA